MNYHNYKRFILSKLEDDEFAFVSNQDMLHLKNVMRLNIGDKFIGIYNDNFDYLCEILAINKEFIKCKILEKTPNLAEPKYRLDIFQALLKGEKMELIAQKCTELGATGFYPFESEFCQVKSTTTRIDRLQKISQESAKQCGRSNYLNISNVLSFNDICELLKSYDKIIFAYELEENKFLNKKMLDGCENIALIIGSEGGFSINEAEKLNNIGVETISLGKRILRAETATIYLCGLVSHYLEGK